MYSAKHIQHALREAVEAGRAPGAAAAVGDREAIRFVGAAGRRQLVPEPQPAAGDTVYDLASVTKVVATTTAVMLLLEAGEIHLDVPVSKYAPVPGLERFTARHLLTHSSGLPPWKPYYLEMLSMDQVLARIGQLPLAFPPGSNYRYSDLGFMVLGRIVELVAADRLDAFCARRIFAPLKMTSTAFNPPPDWSDRFAATEWCTWRGSLVIGAVHDENAYAVGGVSGHAGLFSTAADMARFCQALLRGELLQEKTIEAMTRRGQLPANPWQGLGWRLDPWSDSSAGGIPARSAFGHPGFTGPAVWLDRDSGAFAALLGNTCHPRRKDARNRDFRKTFFTPVGRAVFPEQSNVHPGIDRLIRDEIDLLEGKRIALLTHSPAVDSLGRPTMDVLRTAKNVDLRYVYSPEHGLRGQAEAGERVDEQRAPVEVISLYGRRKSPSAEELNQVDAFVVDLQDVGARYYTYPATMRDCMRACAAAGKRVYVLDRPNPINGLALEGPVAEDADSPVCWGRVPVRHGMTMGELAQWFARTDAKLNGLELRVVPMDGWRRELYFDQCQLPWIPPSPNIPHPDTALLYVGMCLLEGTNLNEGRGTEFPFEVAGAPWLDPAKVMAEIPAASKAGAKLEPVQYTPRSIPGKASNPRFQDQTCQGVRVHIQERRRIRPFLLAAAMISAVCRVHPREFGFREDGWFTTLAGAPGLRKAIEDGADLVEWTQALEQQHAAYREKMPLLYEPQET